MANLKELLQEMVSGAEKHRWNGITPDCVALIFVRSPEEGARSHIGQQALVSNSYPLTPEDAKEYGEHFCEPTWRYVGHIFSHRHPDGGTQFEAHPSPDVSDEKWRSMMKAPSGGHRAHIPGKNCVPIDRYLLPGIFGAPDKRGRRRNEQQGF
jgi:hypothetical protein